MKTPIVMLHAVSAAAILAGCTTASVETPEWRATIRSHWLKRDVDKLDVVRNADGSYSLSLNGYKTDASEQLPAWTREMWNGLGIIGRLATATVNPATASVPLTADAASADEIAKIVQANAAYKREIAEAKTALAAATSAPVQDAAASCSDGSCND